MTVTGQTQIKLFTNAENEERSYLKALRYTIWKPDGSVYDDGHREVYSSLLRRMLTDDNGNTVLIAPFERGEYIFSVELEYERGKVEYAFWLIVDDSWQQFTDEKPGKNVFVSNAAELFGAIASDTTITLAEGLYDVSDTRTLNISGVSNLTLQAAPEAIVEIATPDRFSEVISVNYCDNIVIKDIKMGHSVIDEYMCDAGVVDINNSTDITVENCYVYGSGSIGISISECRNASIVNTVITDCSLYGVNLWKSENISFSNCKLTDHRAYMSVIHGYETSAVFIDCEINGNKSVQYGVVDIDDNVLFERCVFKDNAPAGTYGYMNLFNGRSISIRDCIIELGLFDNLGTDIIDLGGNELINTDRYNLSTAYDVPTILSIRLLDHEDNPLPITAGWVNLQKQSVISVDFAGDATHVEFYTAPTGTETLLEQRIIGIEYVKKGEKNARFEWETPDGFMGYIWVVVYNGDVARTSNVSESLIKAIHELPPA